MNNETIREAVDLWRDDPAECVATWGPMQDWDVSNVTDMSGLFSDVADELFFNEPIGNWNVSAVTDMSGMFLCCSIFNQPIGNWDVSSVTDMCSMFYECNRFNQSISNWNVSAVTNMNFMFGWCREFNQSIGNWNVSSVTNMGGMFRNCYAFNQFIGTWNVSSLTFCREMFWNADSFFQPFGKHWQKVCCNTLIYQVFHEKSKYGEVIENAIFNRQKSTTLPFQPKSPFDVPAYHPFSTWNRRKDLVVFFAFYEKNEGDKSIYNNATSSPARTFECHDMQREICAFL